MKLSILKNEEVNDFKQFVDFWSEMYNYSDEETYNELIKEKQFTDKDIQKLYEWKNGTSKKNQNSEQSDNAETSIAAGKQKSLNDKIISKIDEINALKKTFDLETFLNEFKDVSAVWKFFLLHLIKPDEFPIYDQHTHRAYLYIHEKDIAKVPIGNTKKCEEEKERFYLKDYLQFLEDYKGDSGFLRKIDKALFAFGQTLKQEQFRKLFFL